MHFYVESVLLMTNQTPYAYQKGQSAVGAIIAAID